MDMSPKDDYYSYIIVFIPLYRDVFLYIQKDRWKKYPAAFFSIFTVV